VGFLGAGWARGDAAPTDEETATVPHGTALIATICVSLAVAFVGGFLAVRLRLPPLVGYLLAGVAVGPFTPGFVADA
jgi:monovalent cation:H+ antiporter-2, CPA2 family